MTRFFLSVLACICLGMTACSFSKDTSTKIDSNVPAETGRKQLSVRQNEILIAVRNLDVLTLENLVRSSSIADLNFRGFASTPMSEALKSDSLEITKVVFDLHLDHFNLGSSTDSFNTRALIVANNAVLTSLNHTAETKIHLNKAETFLFEQQKKFLESAVAKDQKFGTLPEINKTSCPFIEGQIILHMISKQELKADFVPVLQSFGCKDSLSRAQLYEIYKTALIAQFQNDFAAPQVLGYIFKHKNFSDQMWNIDNSNIWVSPVLLYRICFNRQNWSVLMRTPYFSQEILDSRKFMGDLGLVTPQFELIDMRNINAPFSFVYFVWQAEQLTEDHFFKKVSYFMHGKKAYIGERDSKNPRIWHDTDEEITWATDMWQESEFVPQEYIEAYAIDDPEQRKAEIEEASKEIHNSSSENSSNEHRDPSAAPQDNGEI